MKTDLQLQADILREINWEPALKSNEIHVAVHEGTVTLTGTVKHFADKFAAERATQRVYGVRAIAENISVNPVGIYIRTDTEVAEAIVHALREHVRIPDSVLATIESGWVTLSGNVEAGYQREAAEEAIRYIPGVRGLSNCITLAHEFNEQQISEALEKLLSVNAHVNSEHIKAIVHDGHVTLAGSVHSWSERREAYTTAWNTPGVTAVQNELTVQRY